MASLKGILYQSGHIDFPRSDNEWAFQRMDTEMGSEQAQRVVVKPELAPLELSRSPEVDKQESQWLERTEGLVNTADYVQLERKDKSLRLRRAVHDLGDKRQLITLCTQEAINDFADEHWKNIAFFYAHRHDGFRFDITKMITLKTGEPERQSKIELITRLVEGNPDDLPHVTFDATGSNAHVEIVEWRGSVTEGDSGRFLLPDVQLHVVLTQARQPITFCHEYRDEFHNDAYLLEGDQLNARVKRAMRRRKTASE